MMQPYTQVRQHKSTAHLLTRACMGCASCCMQMTTSQVEAWSTDANQVKCGRRGVGEVWNLVWERPAGEAAPRSRCCAPGARSKLSPGLCCCSPLTPWLSTGHSRCEALSCVYDILHQQVPPQGLHSLPISLILLYPISPVQCLDSSNPHSPICLFAVRC